MEKVIEILNNLGLSAIDLVMIVFGVLSILFGLIGKAPRKIFRLIFIILSLVAAYFVNKYVGPIVISALEDAGLMTTITDTVGQYLNAEFIDVIIESLLFWVFGILCLIIVPLIGNLIVKICTRKSKKGTAKYTFGIPSLLSTAIIWVFLLLPIILIKPLIKTETIQSETIQSIIDLISDSGNSGSSEEEGDESAETVASTGKKVIMPLGSKVIVTDVEEDEDSTSTSSASSILDDVYVQFAIKSLTESKFLTFTSEKVVPAVEKTISTVSGNSFKFLSVTDDEGNAVSLIENVTKIVENKAVLNTAKSLMSGDDIITSLGNILNMSEDELKAFLNNIVSLTEFLGDGVYDLIKIDDVSSDVIKLVVKELQDGDIVDNLAKLIAADDSAVQLLYDEIKTGNKTIEQAVNVLLTDDGIDACKATVGYAINIVKTDSIKSLIGGILAKTLNLEDTTTATAAQQGTAVFNKVLEFFIRSDANTPSPFENVVTLVFDDESPIAPIVTAAITGGDIKAAACSLLDLDEDEQEDVIASIMSLIQLVNDQTILGLISGLANFDLTQVVPVVAGWVQPILEYALGDTVVNEIIIAVLNPTVQNQLMEALGDFVDPVNSDEVCDMGTKLYEALTDETNLAVINGLLMKVLGQDNVLSIMSSIASASAGAEVQVEAEDTTTQITILAQLVTGFKQLVGTIYSCCVDNDPIKSVVQGFVTDGYDGGIPAVIALLDYAEDSEIAVNTLANILGNNLTIIMSSIVSTFVSIDNVNIPQLLSLFNNQDEVDSLVVVTQLIDTEYLEDYINELMAYKAKEAAGTLGEDEGAPELSFTSLISGKYLNTNDSEELSDRIDKLLYACCESNLIQAVLTIAGQEDMSSMLGMLPIMFVNGVTDNETKTALATLIVGKATVKANDEELSVEVKAKYQFIVNALTPDSTTNELITAASSGNIGEFVGDLLSDPNTLVANLTEVAEIVESLPDSIIGEGIKETVALLTDESVSEDVVLLATYINVGDFLTGDTELMNEIADGDYSGLVNATALASLETAEDKAEIVVSLIESPLVDTLLAAFTEDDEQSSQTDTPAMSTIIAAVVVGASGDDVIDIIEGYASSESDKSEELQDRYAAILALLAD